MLRRSAFLAGTVAAGCTRRASQPVAAPRAAPRQVVALGDSLVLGTGAPPEQGFVFRAYLQLRAAHPGSTLKAFAVGGATIADVARVQVDELRGRRDQVVILCVGGNDVVRRTDPARFAASYRRMLDRTRAAEPAARVICCGVPDVGRSPLFAGAFALDASALSSALDAVVRSVATGAGADFVDLFAVTRRLHATSDLADDRFHPSARGYAALAAVLTPALLRAAR